MEYHRLNLPPRKWRDFVYSLATSAERLKFRSSGFFELPPCCLGWSCDLQGVWSAAGRALDAGLISLVARSEQWVWIQRVDCRINFAHLNFLGQPQRNELQVITVMKQYMCIKQRSCHFVIKLITRRKTADRLQLEPLNSCSNDNIDWNHAPIFLYWE